MIENNIKCRWRFLCNILSFENTSIISGFSEQLLKAILNNDKINPLSLMEQILEPYYKNILI